MSSSEALGLRGVKYAHPLLGEGKESGDNPGFTLQIEELSIKKGEVARISGQNGSGKTTLMHILGQVIRPDQGNLLVSGRDPESDPQLSQTVFTVLQQPFLFDRSVIRSVMMPLLMREVDPSEARERAHNMLGKFELAGSEKRQAWTLSGGEQRRLALSQALVCEPSILLLDEPATNLDAESKEFATRTVVDEFSGTDKTLVIVSHEELSEVEFDRHITLAHGQILID